MNDKKDLLAQLVQSHAALQSTITTFDIEQVIHPDSGWRGRELISHLGAWDREVVKALDAFVLGHEYSIDDYDEDGFNHAAADAQAGMSSAAIIEDWKQARIELMDALNVIPDDRFPGDMQYPWGDESGSIATLIRYFCEHDLEHQNELDEIAKGQKNG
jgi:hypothetical protein